jgi:hypothetical protein
MPKNRRRAPPRKHQSSSARRRAAERTITQRSRGTISRLAVIGAILAVGVVAVVAFLLAGGKSGASPAPTATPPSIATSAPTLARRIDGIPCNDENIGYHVHAHLQIVYDGQNVAVPANIGITNTCVYYLHTHDESGELHIEAPAYRYFTLGNFFDIWGQPLSRSRVASLPLRQGQHVRIYVDGKLYRKNPRAIELRAHRLITLEVGPPFIRPSGFNFEGD